MAVLPPKKEQRSSKCHFTQFLTEVHDEDTKPQHSKKPYSLTQSLPWAHTVDLILPNELLSIVQAKLAAKSNGTLRYSRVFMSLLDVLSGDFFNTYIKRGNILLRSSGRSPVDNIYYIHAGILHLELNRPTYERCGLVGSPIPDGGRKHAKQRFLVKLNLRLPSMLHGKKGFERLIRAAREVLIGDEEWLFVDLNAADEAEKPIEKFHPFQYDVQPDVMTMKDVLVPWMPDDGKLVSFQYAEELLEWLGLVCVGSPRVKVTDDVDPFLCRYSVPQRLNGDTEPPQASDVVHMQWHGFAPPHLSKGILMAAERAATEQQSWFALSVCGFENHSYTILCTSGEEWLCWQCED